MKNRKTTQTAHLYQVSRRLLLQMFLVLVLYTALGVALIAATLIAYYQFVWEGHEFFYRAAHWLYARRELCMVAYIAIGYCAIFLHFWKKPYGFLQEVLDAAENIYQRDDALVALSPSLKNVENQMNQLKLAVQRNEQAARDAEQRKNDMVMYLAHDIKTPLTSVTGYLSLLCEAPDLPEAQRTKYTNIALEKAVRLDRLVDEFFDITRFSLQSIILEKESIGLRLMLDQMADELYPLLAQQQQHIAVAMQEDITIVADADKLARVLGNIIRNASAYGEAGSEIKVTAEKSEDTVIIAIENKGTTIPDEKLALMFDRFYRLDAARSSGTGGAGLGLSIAREIIKAHGGSITAQSADGITAFSIRFPVS